MGAIKQQAELKVAPLLGAQQQQQQQQELIYSFDNDAVHKAALPELLNRGILTANNRAPLPPCSPDMHKVVEHCIARLTVLVNEELVNSDDTLQSVAYWQQRLVTLFTSRITAPQVAADVHSLRGTYQAIINAQGGWPARQYR
jgi:hypothetical protein